VKLEFELLRNQLLISITEFEWQPSYNYIYQEWKFYLLKSYSWYQELVF